jgi:N-acetylmuramoyl-L-alanine amidase
MNLQKLIFTKNPCYIAGRKIKPKGIMVHSTGANNPWLHRYVGPDDGKLGPNKYGNHWNQDTGREVCVHAFIGKLADGSIATYKTLPWDHRGWHAGGSANNTHIGFEICEDHLADPRYFAKVYQEAVELCAYLCKEYDLTEKDIIDHSEGHERGIASNHGDVGYWFSIHGKSMDALRADVRALLGVKAPTDKPAASKKKSNTEIAQEVIDGKWGNGEERKQRLTAAGYDATKVQAEVNKMLKGETAKPSAPKKKSVATIAQEVLAGKWGNGAERKEKLTAAGYDAAAVQAKVNELAKGTAPKPAKKSNTEIAKEVIDGKWGNGAERKEKLKAAGYDATAIQKLVNKMLG